MSKIAVLTDTASDLTPAVARENGIFLIPHHIQLGEDSYLEQYEIEQEETNEWIVNNPDKMPKTSQPSPGEVLSKYEQIKHEGYDTVIFVTLGSAFSSFYNTLNIIEDEDLDIRLIDSSAISTAQGMIALYAKELVDRGYDIESCVEEIEAKKANFSVHAYFSSLKYLKGGGRLGAGIGKFANFLRIKPLIKIDLAGIKVIKASSKENKAVDEIVASVRADLEGVDDYYITLSHDGKAELIPVLEEALAEEIAKAKKVLITKVTPAVCVHAGPGGVGVLLLTLDD